MTARAAVVIGVAVVALLGAGGCRVFGDFGPDGIPCDETSECEADAPFCVAGHCKASEGEGEGEGDVGGAAAGEGEGATAGEGEGEGEGTISAACDDVDAFAYRTTLRALSERCDNPELLVPGAVLAASFSCLGSACVDFIGGTSTPSDAIGPDPRGDGALHASVATPLSLVEPLDGPWALEVVFENSDAGAASICDDDGCALRIDAGPSFLRGHTIPFTPRAYAWRHFMCFFDGALVDCYEEGLHVDNSGDTSGDATNVAGLTIVASPGVVASVSAWRTTSVTFAPDQHRTIAMRRMLAFAGLDVLAGPSSDGLELRREAGAASTTSGATLLSHFVDVAGAAGARRMIELAPGWPPVHVDDDGTVALLVESARSNIVDANLAQWAPDVGASVSCAASVAPAPLAYDTGGDDVAPASCVVTGQIAATPLTGNGIAGDATMSVFVKRPSTTATAIDFATSAETCSVVVSPPGGDDAPSCVVQIVSFADDWVRVAWHPRAVDSAGVSIALPLVTGATLWWPQVEAGGTATTPVSSLGEASDVKCGAFAGEDITLEIVARASTPFLALESLRDQSTSAALAIDDSTKSVVAQDGSAFLLDGDFAQRFEASVGFGDNAPPPRCVVQPCATGSAFLVLDGLHGAALSFNTGDAGPRFVELARATALHP